MNVTAFYIEFVKVFFTSEAAFSISPEENLGTHNLWFHWELINMICQLSPNTFRIGSLVYQKSRIRREPVFGVSDQD